MGGSRRGDLALRTVGRETTRGAGAPQSLRRVSGGRDLQVVGQNDSIVRTRDDLLGLILSRLLNRVDDDHFDRAALVIQLQSKLLLNRREERRSIRIDRRRRRSARRRRTLR